LQPRRPAGAGRQEPPQSAPPSTHPRRQPRRGWAAAAHGVTAGHAGRWGRQSPPESGVREKIRCDNGGWGRQTRPRGGAPWLRVRPATRQEPTGACAAAACGGETRRSAVNVAAKRFFWIGTPRRRWRRAGVRAGARWPSPSGTVSARGRGQRVGTQPEAGIAQAGVAALDPSIRGPRRAHGSGGRRSTANSREGSSEQWTLERESRSRSP